MRRDAAHRRRYRRLKPRLDAAGGFAIIGIVSTQDDRPLAERLGRAYLTHGIEDWTFTGPNGAKVPVTPRNIGRLAWSEQVLEIANAAADLYSEAVLGPLVAKASESSPSGPSDDSTSPTSDSGD